MHLRSICSHATTSSTLSSTAISEEGGVISKEREHSVDIAMDNAQPENAYRSLKIDNDGGGYIINNWPYYFPTDANQRGFTPFLRAVFKGHLLVVDTLIKRGCNIFAKTNDENGALALACQKGHLDIAKLLIGMECSVNETHQDGYTSLHWACQSGHVETVKFLISFGADLEALDKWRYTPFLRAVSNGHAEIIDLIHRKCNMSAKNINGDGALALASINGNLVIARKLLQMGCNINGTNQNGYTSLHWACQSGHDQTSKFLILSGANLEALDKWRYTPFLRAVSGGHSEIIALLCKQGCNISAKTGKGNGALAIASHKGQLDLARQLVELGCSVDEPDQDGFTALQWSCRNGHAQTAEFLVSSGANIESLDKWGYTPFLRAVLEGHSDVMHVLIKRGCSICEKNQYGNGALALASEKGHLDIARTLVELKCSVNELHQDKYTSLHWACQTGSSQIADYLISAGAYIEALNKWGFTPFLCAVFNAHSDVMAVLLKRGCNKFAKDYENNGALALASLQGHLDIVRQLVGMGFSVNEPHQDAFTSLHCACEKGHAQIADFLISCGADIESKNKFGRTPLLEADLNKRYDVQILFEQDKDNRSEVGNSNDTCFKELSNIVRNAVDKENAARSQEIYEEALKNGSVSVNRSRVIVAGQDGAGKSCLVDSLLNRPFEEHKASTEGAAVAMIHTATSGWVATTSKDHLDPLIAQGVYRMNQHKSTFTGRQEGSSESFHSALQSGDLDLILKEPNAGKPERLYDLSKAVESVKPAPQAEPLADDLKTVGMEAKMLTANQQQLVNTFLSFKPSEEVLRKEILGVRDIWDLGGQEVYLATHSALMPDNKAFGLSMYMIVMDISKSLSDKARSFHRSSDGEVIDQTSELGWVRTNGDFPLYWFGSITAAHEEPPMGDHWLGKDEDVDPPPVFAIGSHRDVLDSDKEKFPDSKSVKMWLSDQEKSFEDVLSNSDFMKHIVEPKEHGFGEDDKDFREMAHFFKRIFLIDNSVSGSRSPCKGVTEIRKRVDRMTNSYCKEMEKQPLFWVYLEILLFRWSNVMRTVVAKVDEIAKLAQHPTIICISSREEVLVALKYLANVGAILYYPEVEDLKDFVFTRPMWVIKALSAFVTAAKPGPRMEPHWNVLKKEGVMSNDLMNYRLRQMRLADSGDLGTALKEADREKMEEDNKVIVRLLELLDVITPVERSSQRNFYVPSMLKTSFLRSFTYWKRLTSTDSESPFCALPAPLIVIPRKLKFFPECLFFRLITRFLKVYPNKPRLARHQCLFLVEDKSSQVEVEVELLFHNRGKWVALTIHFVNEEDSEKRSEGFLELIKKELCQQMKHVCQQGMRGFKYSICCQTKKAVSKENEVGIDFESLPVIISENCNYSPQNSSQLYNPFNVPLPVKQDDLLRINCWFRRQRIVVQPSSQDALPKDITDSLIHVVATQLQAKWQTFALALGRKTRALSQYKDKFDENVLRATIVIEDWVAECGQKATVNALIGACEDCGIHRDNIEAAYKEKSKK